MHLFVRNVERRRSRIYENFSISSVVCDGGEIKMTDDSEKKKPNLEKRKNWNFTKQVFQLGTPQQEKNVFYGHNE